MYCKPVCKLRRQASRHYSAASERVFGFPAAISSHAFCGHVIEMSLIQYNYKSATVIWADSALCRQRCYLLVRLMKAFRLRFRYSVSSPVSRLRVVLLFTGVRFRFHTVAYR